ncbi:DNA-binding protein [Umezawaea sp. NPDC059074]|uniref:DNA-binding protein n=1 Tax=Umezawaea sp. NPDC059074 TaxID=3346716 RepID=UPI00367B3CB1
MDLPESFPAPARRALENAGYTSLDQLTTVTGAELLRLHGFGPKGLRLLREELAARGLDLAG